LECLYKLNILRLLKIPEKLDYLEVQIKSLTLEDDVSRDPGLYESLWWDKVDDIIEQITKLDLEVEWHEKFTSFMG